MNQIDILLVEDSHDDAEITLRTLKQIGMSDKVHWAKDGEEALDFIEANLSKAHLPKVILLDLKLPKVDGLEVLQAIRSNPELSKIPVVILTSSNEESDLLKSYSIGANSYIVKPVDFNSYSESIAEIGKYWLNRNQVPMTA
ncbi:MAG: response regulator [Cyclobacteriaceae bacterium]